jgi:molybdopterin converting factor small subunit
MIEINIYRFKKIIKALNQILTPKFELIMATLEELQVKLAELQETVDAEQAQVSALVDAQNSTIVGLEAQIKELTAMVNAAPTPEQIQAVVDGLEVIKSDIAGTV